MQCVHTLEANIHAYQLGLADRLEEQKKAYINIQAEQIIDSKYSSEYQDVISMIVDHEDSLTKYDTLVNQIINADDINKLFKLKNELRALINSVACDYVAERMKRLGDR